MTRRYKRTPGSRKYADFTASTLEECLNAIRSGELSQKQPADRYNISRSAIKRRLKNDLPIKPRQMAFASHLDKVCDFGFPVDDFRYIVKCYLENQGRSVEFFCNNLPVRDLVKLFMKRHPHLSIRFANNIKRARAAIDKTVITQYVDNLSDLTSHPIVFIITMRRVCQMILVGAK
ncbi:hypothetical protein J437_LFUL012575 [Ladona fulva]|uniref:HTH psq-type domain-containing protein n=1 Tax=Ladona fulva TaxID=123851 RepID=A0A8K0KKM4_LADFU|nr:hypothetical protein J437_LFUL012575 [Ladona fulva]